MKKNIIILVAAMLLFVTGCSSKSDKNDPVESVFQNIHTQETAAAMAEEETAAYAEPVAETIDYTGFSQEAMEDILYRVPESWRKTDYSNETIKQNMYYLDESNDNCIMTMYLNINNQIYTREQAEEYMDIFMNGFFSSQNSYSSNGEISVHKSNVPARHGSYLSNGVEVDVYCYLPSTTNVFILSNWHNPNSSNRIDEDTYRKVIDSVQLPELDVEDDTPSADTNKSQSSGFSNEYGTATTQCAYPGCSQKIASSGDTNCCTKHSNKCGNCGCYIDSDAMFCMSCLSGSLGGSSDSYDYDKGYGYTAPKKGQSFSDYVKEQDPDLYNSLFK